MKSHLGNGRSMIVFHCFRWYHIKNTALVLMFFTGFLVFSGPKGRADSPQLFGTTGLDQSFCKDKTFRQTVVYVDADSVQKGDTSWATNLENKLRATLTPGERVTVVELLPDHGTSSKLWSACWPNYTATQRAKLAKENFFFSSNPLNNLEKQQGFFFNGFGAAITQVFLREEKGHKNDRSTVNGAPKEELLESLASDGARFSQTDETIRVIVYSNAAQNSALGSVYDARTSPMPDFGKELGTYFRHSIFYFFGVHSTKPNDPNYLAESHAFWSQALATMSSTVAGFGSDLSVANEVPVVEKRFHVSLDRNNLELSGLLNVMTDADGDLIDSWLGITRLGFVSITGSYKCDDGTCVLHASTNQGLVTTSNTEKLSMKGTLTKGLSGTIGVPGSVTFPITASAVR
ncbi:MAG: hypothetical protein PHI71_08395 [Acidiphilium sp.]|nr:hypothetical protein [Acidiphilium sp.]